MALVPYRVSGAAADQRAVERLLQLPGGVTMRLTQWPGLSGAAPPPEVACSRAAAAAAATGPPPPGDAMECSGPPLESLANVGLVVWQAGFLLAEYLLRTAPFAAAGRGDAATSWRPLTAVDLGTGSGVVGIALALSGARVFLTDLPHVLPLAAANVAGNCDPRVHRAHVCPYRWGDDPGAPQEAAVLELDTISVRGGETAPAAAGAAAAAAVERRPLSPAAPSLLAGLEPDLITAADVLYHRELLAPLISALQALSAPHTVSYVSYRVRQGGEVAAFMALAEAAGFAAEEVADAELHEEYRGGGGGGGGMDVDGGSDGGDDAMGLGQSVECVGPRMRAVGTYGILRLCRRDCRAAVAAGAKGSGARDGSGVAG